MSYIIAILVFGLLIFVHELGHFVVAKLSGITVLQFTIGFGPAIFKSRSVRPCMPFVCCRWAALS